MEPKFEVWKCPESNVEMGTSQTCELPVPDLKAPNDDADMAPTSNCCENTDTETGVFDWGTGEKRYPSAFLLQLLFLLDFLWFKVCDVF